jgi:hypothetical protein
MDFTIWKPYESSSHPGVSTNGDFIAKTDDRTCHKSSSKVTH